MTKRLFLFDIDGTLLTGLGPYENYEKTMEEAIRFVFRRDVNLRKMSSFNGMTERKILECALVDNRVSYNSKKLARCMTYFSEATEFPKDEINLIDGAKETLEYLHKKNNLLSVVTGNSTQIALKKLRLCGLDSFFKFIVGGEISSDRTDLYRIAIEKNIKGFFFNNLERTYAVGDSLQEIICARELGINSISVSTGNYSKRELLLRRPDFAFENLFEMKNYF